MNNKVIYLCWIFLFMQGCKSHYYVSEIKLCMGKEEELDFKIEYICDTTMTQRYYFAMDSVLVCNTNLSELGNTISNRVFNSDDIGRIRSEINLDTHYIVIEHADGGYLGNICDKNKIRFDIKEDVEKHCFYLMIPYKKNGFRFRLGFYDFPFKKRSYLKIIPITYIDKNTFFVHINKGISEAEKNEIRKILSNNLDSVSIDMWIKRCEEGEKTILLPMYMINNSIRYIH